MSDKRVRYRKSSEDDAIMESTRRYHATAANGSLTLYVRINLRDFNVVIVDANTKTSVRQSVGDNLKHAKALGRGFLKEYGIEGLDE